MCINNASLFLTYQSINWWQFQFIFYWNWMMTVFLLHISATLHLTIFGIWSNNLQSVQYVICVMIVRSNDILGWQYDTQYELLCFYVHREAPFFVLTVKRHCLYLARLPQSLAVLQMSIIRLLQYDWLSGYWRVMNTVTCAMETRFLNIYSTFLWPLMNECNQKMVVVFARICSAPMPNFTSI